jgi:hypothetical protein
LSKLTDVFRNTAKARLASLPTVPSPDGFFEAARSLLATDLDLVGRIQKARQRKQLRTDPVKTLGEKELVLVEIWRSIISASDYDPNKLLLPNNHAAILGGLRLLMAFLVAKGLLSPNSDPLALKRAQAFLIESRRDANKLRRQINGAIRHEPRDGSAMAWLRATAPVWRQRKPNASSSAGARWLFALARKKGITKWSSSESLRVSAIKNSIRI